MPGSKKLRLMTYTVYKNGYNPQIQMFDGF